jgi:hypothetical protein
MVKTSTSPEQGQVDRKLSKFGALQKADVPNRDRSTFEEVDKDDIEEQKETADQRKRRLLEEEQDDYLHIYEPERESKAMPFGYADTMAHMGLP